MKLLLVIGPLGMSDVKIQLLPDDAIGEHDLLNYTKGEGQALFFDLINYDTSLLFFEAIDDGRFLADYGNKWFRVAVDTGKWYEVKVDEKTTAGEWFEVKVNEKSTV